MSRSQLPTPTRARATLASRTARYGQDHPETVSARRAYETERLELHIRQVVDAAPPIFPEARDRLATLLRPSSTPAPEVATERAGGAA